jgi:hypothetical protein
MSLLNALQVSTYSHYFKDILANKYEIATLGVDHVKMSEQCSATIANGLEKQTRPGHSVLTEPIGSVLRFSVKFGSQQIRTEYRTVRFGSGSVLFRF